MREFREGPQVPTSAAESVALGEIEWFYARFAGKDPDGYAATAEERKAALLIAGGIRQIATFHAGALRLRFAPRAWPESLTAEFGPWTSLIVRLECAAVANEQGASPAALEKAALGRLEEMLADEYRHGAKLDRLERHASKHVRAAVQAYVKVRPRGPSVLPSSAKEGA